MNTGASHGAALGEEEIQATKKFLGFDPDEHFHVDEKVLAHTRELVSRGTKAQRMAAAFRRLGQEKPRTQRTLRPHGGIRVTRELRRRYARLGSRF